MTSLFGLPVLDQPIPVSPAALQLITRGIEALWTRIVAARPLADYRPLLLSYDVHPTPDGPVLIEVNSNAGGVLTAMQAARHVNDSCADWEYELLAERLRVLFRRDLLGDDPQSTGIVAIVDDQLASQPLLSEMRELGKLLRPLAQDVLMVDASDLDFRDGRLRYSDKPIDRVYWRSTDFLLSEPVHAPVRQAVLGGSIVLAPSPEAYQAIADKRRFVEWSKQPELARDAVTGLTFRIAETVPLSEKPAADWYAQRGEWVFKPMSGYASRGVYVGRSISRLKLATLSADAYLAQQYTPHPIVDRDGKEWKYDVRFFADRGQVIGAAARVFHGQVVGMRDPGSGFAPVRVGATCCLVGALATAQAPGRDP
jgi:hypothetical protein